MTMSVSNQQIIEALYAISKDRFNQPDMLMEIEALPMIAKAISKAVGEDTIAYIENCQTVTANAIRLLIIDNINTNIKKYLSACTDDLELRYLNISGWKRLLIIDHTHKLTFTVHSAVSLKKQPPCYLQLIIKQRGAEPPVQLALPGFEPNNYTENDFTDTADAAFTADDLAGFQHLVISYSHKNEIVTSLELVQFDRNMNDAGSISLMDLIAPDILGLSVTAQKAAPIDMPKENTTGLVRLKTQSIIKLKMEKQQNES